MKKFKTYDELSKEANESYKRTKDIRETAKELNLSFKFFIPNLFWLTIPVCIGKPSLAYILAYWEIVLNSRLPNRCNILKIAEKAAGTPALKIPWSGTSVYPLVTKFKKLNFLGDTVLPFKTIGS